MTTNQKTIACARGFLTTRNSMTAQKYAIPQSIAAATNFTGIASSVQSSKKFSDAAQTISAASAIEKRTSWPRRIRFLSAKLTDLDSLGRFHGSCFHLPAATRNALEPRAVSREIHQFRHA